MLEDTSYLYLAGTLGICILLTNLWLDYTTPNVTSSICPRNITVPHLPLQLKSIPAVGPSGRFTSFLGVYRYLKNGQAVIQEGVEKYKSAIFRIPMVDKWAVIVSENKSIDDIRQARDEDLSFYDAVNDVRSHYPSPSAFPLTEGFRSLRVCKLNTSWDAISLIITIMSML